MEHININVPSSSFVGSGNVRLKHIKVLFSNDLIIGELYTYVIVKNSWVIGLNGS